MPARNPASPFRSVRPGDTVTRILGGGRMQLVVTEVDERFIYCGRLGGWKFDLDTGFEVDEDIGWGPEFGVTGSFLLSPKAAAYRRAAPKLPEADRPALVRFRTQTGSRYEVDNVGLTWRRSPTLASGVLRSESGELLAPARPVLGESVVLIGPPYEDRPGNRAVVTTPVVEIEPAPKGRPGIRSP